jgi:hypothetical protein
MHWIMSQLPGMVLAVVLLAFVLRDVTRARLERFARRQALDVTVTNGPVVIDYLATTRRWRVAGFVGGLLIEFGATFTHQARPSIGGVGALVGWFVGALVAEWRMESRHGAGVRRAASLSARRISDYVPQWFVAVNLAVWAGALTLGVTEATTLRPLQWSVVVELAFAAAVTPATWLVARRVLARPQTLVAPDVLAADDALRSRSLHVLAGCALAINGFLAALITSAGQILGANWLPDPWSFAIDVVGAFVLPLLGWVAATSPFATRRRALAYPSGVPA